MHYPQGEVKPEIGASVFFSRLGVKSKNIHTTVPRKKQNEERKGFLHVNLPFSISAAAFFLYHLTFFIRKIY